MAFDNPLEDLYRVITHNPNMWNIAENRPTSANFTDSQGTSVDRQASRSQAESFAEIYSKDKFVNSKGIACVAVANCNLKSVFIEEDPLPDNIYHSLLKKDAITPKLTRSQANYLAENARFYPKLDTGNG